MECVVTAESGQVSKQKEQGAAIVILVYATRFSAQFSSEVVLQRPNTMH